MKPLSHFQRIADGPRPPCGHSTAERKTYQRYIYARKRCGMKTAHDPIVPVRDRKQARRYMRAWRARKAAAQ